MAQHCVTITGLQSMVKKLHELGQDIDRIADESLHKSAYDIKREIESNIRSSGAVDTGALLRSITVEKLGPCRYAVGTDAEHAAPVEFGTGFKGDPAVAHTARPKWTYYSPIHGGFRTAYPQPARPFMRPAFNAKRETVTLNMTNAITKAWGKAAGL